MHISFGGVSAFFDNKLGVFASLWIACTSFAGVALANIGIALLMLAILLDARRLWQSFWPEIIFRAWSLCFVMATVSLLLASRHDGLLVHLGGYVDFLKLGLFLPIGWYLGVRLHYVWLALAGGLFGFLLGRILNWPFGAGLELAMLNRFGFGFTSISFGTYCAIGLIGVLVVLPRMRRNMNIVGGFVFLAGLVIAGALLAGMIFSLSRAVWIVFALVAVVTLVCGFFVRGAGLQKLHSALVVVIAMACVSFFMWDSNVVKQRLAQESEVYFLLMEGRFEAVGYSSIGLRLRAWYYAWECWKFHPWLGLGPGMGGSQLLRLAPDAALRGLSHFHNIAVEWLVRLGGVGLSAAFALLLMMIKRLVEVWRSEAVPRDLIAIVSAGLAILLLTGLSNFRLLSSDGRHCWLILAGCAVALSFYVRRLGKISE